MSTHMYKKRLKFNGYKTWELLSVLETIGKRDDDNLIKGNGWSVRIIKEDVESIFRGFSLPVVELEIEGDEEHVNSLIKELKLRLLKAGG